MAKKVAQLRKTLLDSVEAGDIQEVVRGLIDEAKAGNVPAARELLERVLGKPVELDFLERLEAIEQRLAEMPNADRSR